MASGGLRHPASDGLGHVHGVTGEELDALLVGLVAAQQAVGLVVAAAVHGGVQQVVQAQHHTGPGGLQKTLGAGAGVNVAANHGVGVVQHGLHPVAEHDLRLGAHALDQLLVEADVIHAGEGVHHAAEGGPELGKAQHVVPGVDALLVQLIHAHQMVAHLVGGVAQQQHHLFTAAGDALQEQRKPVAAEDGERDTYRLAAGLGPHVGADIGNGGVVALAAGHHRLGDGHDVAVTGGDAVFPDGVHHRVHGDGHNVVALTENGRPHAPHHGADGSVHHYRLPFKGFFTNGALYHSGLINEIDILYGGDKVD